MQISLRSQMIAGTAAIVGASAIAMTPVVAQHATLPDIQVPSAASLEVSLAGFDSPISELFRTAGQVNELFFGTGAYPAPIGTQGIIPQIINDHLPIISQLGINGSNYLVSTLNAGARIGFALSEGVWNAAGDLLSFNIPGALNTLLAAVTVAGNTALAAGQYVLNNVLAKVQALAGFASSTLGNLLPIAVGQATYLVNTVVGVFQDIATNLGAANYQGAWNAAIDGFFGPGLLNGVKQSIPGALIGLTLGAGVPGPVPSLRYEVSALVKGVKLALSTSVGSPIPPPAAAVPARSSAAVAPAPSPSALRTVAKSTAAEAPSVTAGGNSSTPGDNNKGGGSSSGGSSGGGSSHSGTGHSKR